MSRNLAERSSRGVPSSVREPVRTVDMVILRPSRDTELATPETFRGEGKPREDALLRERDFNNQRFRVRNKAGISGIRQEMILPSRLSLKDRCEQQPRNSHQDADSRDCMSGVRLGREI